MGVKAFDGLVKTSFEFEKLEGVDGESSGFNYRDRLRWNSLRNRVLYLHDSIDDFVAREKSMELKKLTQISGDPILIVITSPGGVVLPGLALYDEILETRSRGVNVIMRVSGYAASMAAIVLQAATIREAFVNSRILIHEVRQFKFWSEDSTSYLEEELGEMKKLQEILYSILSKRTGRDIEEIKKTVWKTNRWFSSWEAKEFGLIDRIVNQDGGA